MAHKATDTHIEQIKAGNEEAWEFVEKDFEVGLRSQASRLLKSSCLIGRLSVDDLVQETWLKAWNARSSFKGAHVPEFVKWLLVILKNIYFDKCRKGRFELAAPNTVENSIGVEKTPSEIVSSAESNLKLRAMLGKLDNRSRKIVTLKHFEGLTFRQIAKILGRNPNSVASTYRRAIQSLNQRFSEGSSGCLRIS